MEKIKLESSWKDILEGEFKKRYMLNLNKFLISEQNKYSIFPANNKIFNAFNTTPFDKIKVVILGQDPYHGKGQSHGLSFSIENKNKVPPSLINIFNEIEEDLKIKNNNKGDLTQWAEQGVLLLNSILTVRENTPGSHQNQGWERFTDKVISLISKNKKGVVFMLWGKFAGEKSKLINTMHHHILYSSHPSPLSAYRGFFGCNHFSKCNNILKQQNKKEINWKLL